MIRTVLLALLASLAASASGCGPTNDAPPNVVICLVDQLRFDAAEAWMPKTHALAKEGVRFQGMRAVAPWTYPSVISLFSGLYPQQHGADGNRAGTVMSTFSEGVPLLPRLFRQEGYHTAGFITNPFLHEWNPFHGAFEEYQAQEFINSQGNNRGKGKLVWRDTMWANTVNPAVLEHFRGRERTSPEFTYVHYIDVHGLRAGPTRWEGAPFQGSYEAACRYLDERILELYRFFHERYEGNLVFLVTSDHGEDFDDDETVGAGEVFRKKKATVHDFNLRIPCWILPGDGVPKRVIDGPTANVDVTPTLLSWAGLDVPPVLSGTDLYRHVLGEPYDGTEREIYAKTSSMNRHNDCLIFGGRKYLRHFDPASDRVVAQRTFDLSADPRETYDLGADFGELQERLERAAGDRGYAFPALFEDPAESLRQAWEDLGYAGGSDD